MVSRGMACTFVGGGLGRCDEGWDTKLTVERLAGVYVISFLVNCVSRRVCYKKETHLVYARSEARATCAKSEKARKTDFKRNL